MKKTIDYYRNLPYTVELTLSPEGGWFIEIPWLYDARRYPRGGADDDG